MGEAARDQNFRTTLLAVSSADGVTPVVVYADPVTHRLLVDSASGSGDVVGPASSTDDAIVRFDGATGKLIQNSGVIIDDSNNMTGVVSLTASGDIKAERIGLEDSNSSHYLYIDPGSNITADRVLTVTTGDADRTLTLDENLTASGVVLLAGRSGGQTINGDTAANGNLNLEATSNPTKTSSLINLAFSGGSVNIGNYTGTGVAIGTFPLAVASGAIFGSGGGIATFGTISNGGGLAFTTGTLGSDTVSFKRTDFLVSGDYNLNTKGNLAISTATGKMLTLQPTVGNVGVGTTTPDRKFHVEVDDAVTNAVTYSTRYTHTTSGTPANGIGVGLELEVETSAGNNEVGATLEAVATDVTSTTEVFALDFSVMSAGTLAKEMRLTGTALSPFASDGSALGTSSLMWSDLFLASGAVVNFNNGDVTLTHSADLLTLAGGNLIISSPGSAAGSVTTIDGTQTLSNKTLTAPKFADLGFIADANGNELVIFDTVDSAVNEITLANAATGSNPNITASGGDSNIGIDLTPKGTGFVQIKGNSTQAATLALYEDTDDGSNYSAFRGSARAGNIIYTMPTADPTAGQALTAGAPSGGVSQLSWASAGGGAWTLVSYTTATGVSTVTVSSLDLSTHLHYRVIVISDGSSTNDELYARVNGITTSTYSTACQRAYISGGVNTETAYFSAGVARFDLSGGLGWDSHTAQIDIDLTKTDGTNLRPVINFEAGSFGRSTSADFGNFTGSGTETSQSNVTSLTFFAPGGTNRDWKVWVLRPNTA